MKSKNSEFSQNNYQFKRCVEKLRKMHKLCAKVSKIESKSIYSKNLVTLEQKIESNDEVDSIAIKNNIEVKRSKFEKFKFEYSDFFNF